MNLPHTTEDGRNGHRNERERLETRFRLHDLIGTNPIEWHT